jgi:hypothetical protein
MIQYDFGVPTSFFYHALFEKNNTASNTSASHASFLSTSGSSSSTLSPLESFPKVGFLRAPQDTPSADGSTIKAIRFCTTTKHGYALQRVAGTNHYFMGWFRDIDKFLADCQTSFPNTALPQPHAANFTYFDIFSGIKNNNPSFLTVGRPTDQPQPQRKNNIRFPKFIVGPNGNHENILYDQEFVCPEIITMNMSRKPNSALLNATLYMTQTGSLLGQVGDQTFPISLLGGENSSQKIEQAVPLFVIPATYSTNPLGAYVFLKTEAGELYITPRIPFGQENILAQIAVPHAVDLNAAPQGTPTKAPTDEVSELARSLNLKASASTTPPAVKHLKQFVSDLAQGAAPTAPGPGSPAAKPFLQRSTSSTNGSPVRPTSRRQDSLKIESLAVGHRHALLLMPDNTVNMLVLNIGKSFSPSNRYDWFLHPLEALENVNCSSVHAAHGYTFAITNEGLIYKNYLGNFIYTTLLAVPQPSNAPPNTAQQKPISVSPAFDEIPHGPAGAWVFLSPRK